MLGQHYGARGRSAFLHTRRLPRNVPDPNPNVTNSGTVLDTTTRHHRPVSLSMSLQMTQSAPTLSYVPPVTHPGTAPGTSSNRPYSAASGQRASQAVMHPC
ncbi:hypothetical protein Bbelb_338990 [Branchiostoma belcheri]|nr:hypothetical protein Bbelb_338990 [Branchiostoma belcheri]